MAALAAKPSEHRILVRAAGADAKALANGWRRRPRCERSGLLQRIVPRLGAVDIAGLSQYIDATHETSASTSLADWPALVNYYLNWGRAETKATCMKSGATKSGSGNFHIG